MVSEERRFNCSGPLYLSSVNWNNAHHQRAVAASLIQGVYNLERDRQAKREGSKALAPLWWKFFNFQLQRILVDTVDSSIFGAIFEYKPPTSSGNHSADGPHLVVAFRGTLFKTESFYQDMKLNGKLILQKLPSEPRCKIAVEAVQKIAEAGVSRVWLAGHSLGSAIALSAVKTMGRTGLFLRSFLFNPPYPSAPIEEIENENLKSSLHFVKNSLKFGAMLAMNALELGNQSTDSFAALSPCLPQLYVHKDDPICSAYIGYFEQRNKMEVIGAGYIEKLATQQSTLSLIRSAVTGKWTTPLHVIPSANLTINSTPSDGFRGAHSISQWWQRDLKVKSKHYMYS